MCFTLVYSCASRLYMKIFFLPLFLLPACFLNWMEMNPWGWNEPKKEELLSCLPLLHKLFLFQSICGQLLLYLVLQICCKILKTSSGNMWSNIEYPKNKEWDGQEKEERSFCFHWTFPFALWFRYKTWTIFSPNRVTFRCNSNVRFLRLALIQTSFTLSPGNVWCSRHSCWKPPQSIS